MATYKVPQDVEADDKLIGPFTFRQFIYLIVVALSIALAWALSHVFIGLVLIPMPVIILFGALALPLRKDQPMETYLAAMVSFYLKPHRRIWDPDGLDSLIEITAPKIIEYQLTKDISETEVQRRLGYLATIVDTQGWAVRGPGVQAPNTAMVSDAYFEAQQVEDVLSDDNRTAQSFAQKLDKSDELRHQAAMNLASGKTNNFPNQSTYTQPQAVIQPQTYTQPQAYVQPQAQSQTYTQPTAPIQSPEPQIEYNPYPDEMRQRIVEPLADINHMVHQPKPTTSEKPASADIINLANNADLSIETIAREANRIHKKQDLGEEVVISLR